MSSVDFTLDWSQENIVANQPATVMRIEPSTIGITAFTCPRRGSLMLVGVDLDGNVTAGTLTILIRREPGQVEMGKIIINPGESTGRLFEPEGSRIYKPNEKIQVVTSTSANFLPTGTLDLTVRAVLRFDITN